MADFATAVGFIQFPVNEREANGEQVRDVTIRTPGTDGTLVRVTLWPAFDEAEVVEGDFIAVDGKLNVREVEGKTYVNIDANKLHWKGHDFIASRETARSVVKKPAKKAF